MSSGVPAAPAAAPYARARQCAHPLTPAPPRPRAHACARSREGLLRDPSAFPWKGEAPAAGGGLLSPLNLFFAMILFFAWWNKWL